MSDPIILNEEEFAYRIQNPQLRFIDSDVKIQCGTKKLWWNGLAWCSGTPENNPYYQKKYFSIYSVNKAIPNPTAGMNIIINGYPYYWNGKAWVRGVSYIYKVTEVPIELGDG